jgi:hypothetical protein
MVFEGQMAELKKHIDSAKASLDGIDEGPVDFWDSSGFYNVGESIDAAIFVLDNMMKNPVKEPNPLLGEGLPDPTIPLYQEPECHYHDGPHIYAHIADPRVVVCKCGAVKDYPAEESKRFYCPTKSRDVTSSICTDCELTAVCGHVDGSKNCEMCHTDEPKKEGE